MRRGLITLALLLLARPVIGQTCSSLSINLPSTVGSPFQVIRLGLNGAPDSLLSNHTTENVAAARAIEAQARDPEHVYRVRRSLEWRPEVCIPISRVDTIFRTDTIQTVRVDTVLIIRVDTVYVDTIGTDTTTPPPPTGNLTPAALRISLGPTISRADNPPEWPAVYERDLDAAIDSMTARVKRGSYTYITDGGDQNNPHYGPLKLVAMRNLRVGLPLDTMEAGFAAAFKVTREFVTLYAAPNDYRLQAHRNTNWADCEIVIAVYPSNPLATQCRTYLHSTANWLTTHLTSVQENLDHHWMDERIIALALELALAADRLGIPYAKTIGTTTGSWPAGITSWRGYVETHIAGFVQRMQDKTFARWGGTDDPTGKPILAGNIRYGQNGGWQCSAMPCTNYVQPYPILFFEDAMLANALLRAWHQIGCTQCRDEAIAMANGVVEHFNGSLLPYRSHGNNMWTDADDLDGFWIRPLLEIGTLTNDAKYRQIALTLAQSAHRGAWSWRMKQAQQLGAATEPQSGPAWLAGIR